MPEELARSIAELKTGLAVAVTDEPTRAELEYAIDQIVEVALRSHPWERLAAHMTRCWQAHIEHKFHCSVTLFGGSKHAVTIAEHVPNSDNRIASQYDTDLSAAVDRCIAEFAVKP